MDDILVPVSPGELLDKLTILRLKQERIADPGKRANVIREREALEAVVRAGLPDRPEVETLGEELYGINAALWDIEDAIRACEAAGDFGPRFVSLARSVYHTNDRRAAVKREINLALGSALVEEKSYSDYGRQA